MLAGLCNHGSFGSVEAFCAQAAILSSVRLVAQKDADLKEQMQHICRALAPDLDGRFTLSF